MKIEGAVTAMISEYPFKDLSKPFILQVNLYLCLAKMKKKKYEEVNGFLKS